MPSTQTEPEALVGSKAAACSNLVVRLMSEYTGRGPTKARTYLQDRLAVVILEDTLTKGERSLVRDGESALVLNNRRAYQHTMRSELLAGIEQILGRKVIAFMSENHIDPDMAVEIFVLAPEGHDNGVNGVHRVERSSD